MKRNPDGLAMSTPRKSRKRKRGGTVLTEHESERMELSVDGEMESADLGPEHSYGEQYETERQARKRARNAKVLKLKKGKNLPTGYQAMFTNNIHCKEKLYFRVERDGPELPDCQLITHSLEGAFGEVVWNILVVDEAHLARNPNSANHHFLRMAK